MFFLAIIFLVHILITEARPGRTEYNHTDSRNEEIEDCMPALIVKTFPLQNGSVKIRVVHHLELTSPRLKSDWHQPPPRTKSPPLTPNSKEANRCRFTGNLQKYIEKRRDFAGSEKIYIVSAHNLDLREDLIVGTRFHNYDGQSSVFTSYNLRSPFLIGYRLKNFSIDRKGRGQSSKLEFELFLNETEEERMRECGPFYALEGDGQVSITADFFPSDLSFDNPNSLFRGSSGDRVAYSLSPDYPSDDSPCFSYIRRKKQSLIVGVSCPDLMPHRPRKVRLSIRWWPNELRRRFNSRSYDFSGSESFKLLDATKPTAYDSGERWKVIDIY